MTKDKKLYIASAVLAFGYAAEFFITGIFIFMNMYYTFEAMPFILSAIALLPLIFAIINIFIFENSRLSVAIIAVSVIMAVGHFLFAAYVLSKLTFLLITGIPVFIVLGIVGAFLFMVLAYPKLKKVGKRISVAVLSLVIFFVSVFGILKLNFFYYTSDGVVFAVEDEYQIAWSTSVKSTGSVTVNGKTYYDMSNGENRVSTLHKVSVPMSELDNAKSYTLSSTPVYSEAAYLSVSGKERQKTYSFRPADSSDGLQIYNISDNHEVLSGAANAGRYFGDDLDILILNGDNINDVSSLWQISLIYKLASRITGGERPVIYVRGNHECNGRYAADLHDYLPGKDGNLYYTTTLGGAFFMVLDTNCDMSDENLLITPAANFEELRREQTEWLNAQTYFGGDCDYSILLAHMAFPLSDYERFPEWTEELTAATDGRFDVCISGHSHVLDYAEAGTETRTSYPVIRGSIRSNRRTSGEGVNPFEFTGTAIECTGGNMNVKFTNSNREVLQEFSIDLR